ncbi:MAG: glycosyltransferase, partial [Nitrosopumilus sp. YT1]
MKKIGQFIYPWGNGHYTRMMRLDEVLPKYLSEEFDMHYFSKGEIYKKLLEKFPDKQKNIHEILMPTPIDGKVGPSISLSLLNIFFPVADNPSLVNQVKNYMKKEREFYNKEKFDLVINDGDMGSNVLANKRGIPSLFVTNQYMPRLWKSRSYLKPGLYFVSKQIAKATRILVADSAPPHTICEYNLNFPDTIKDKVTYVGHFSNRKSVNSASLTDLERLVDGTDFGYWMRTGNKSTNDGAGQRYEEVFHETEMKNERRIISHAKNDKSIDKVVGKDGKKYSVLEAYEKKVDWMQIDIGFLTEHERQTVLKGCKYAVINGSHTVMGEIMGVSSKPIIGMPIYDEH